MIEFLKDLYFRKNVKDIEGFRKYAKQFNLTEDEINSSYGYYKNKCWNSASQYFEKANKRMRNQLNIR